MQVHRKFLRRVLSTSKRTYPIEVMVMLKCRLRVIFAERELKQREFAKSVGISEATLSALVGGKQLPTLEVAYRIAEKLDFNVMDIWVRTDK